MTKKLLIFLGAMLFSAVTVSAQPQARRNAAQQKMTGTQKKQSNTNTITQRALISFPTQQKMEEDVVWRRDVYRELDLTKDENSGLYYPVEPVGSQMNLFTYMFKLMLSGQITAYEYRIDGNESFEPDAKVKPLAFLDNNHIFYERKDGKMKIDNSDIPSREVKSYYVKESSYYDQRTATFHTKVIALCPIMSTDDDFGDGAVKKPLFWVKYDDVAPFLSKQMIMTSNLNNAAVMSIDDYFTKNKYRGTIYKTNNMLGKVLGANVSADPDDEEGMQKKKAVEAEQKKIEAELKAFEENIWGDKARKDSLDSIAKMERDSKGKKVKKSSRRSSSSSKSEVKEKKPKTKSSSSSSSSSARVSVRRQRH